MVSARPAIEDLHDLDATVADEERAGHFFASVARGALHANDHSRIRFHTERAGGLSWQAGELDFRSGPALPMATSPMIQALILARSICSVQIAQ